LEGELELVDKLGQACHELGAPGMIFRAIILIDEQGLDLRKTVTLAAPEIH
jgi:hypothetical protein